MIGMLIRLYRPRTPRHRRPGRGAVVLETARLALFIVLTVVAEAVFSTDAAAAPRTRKAVLEVPAIDPVALQQRDAAAVTEGSYKIAPFAEPFGVNAPSRTYGVWDTTSDSRALWQLFVHAPGATDVNLGITNAVLPAGCVLRIYAADGSLGAGPYMADDLTDDGQLWTPVLPGQDIVLEAEMPVAARSAFRLDIGQVGSGYLDVFHAGFPGADSTKQGTCNNDVICPVANGWRDAIRSVAVYTISGSWVCTGTLVMNARRDYRAYFLSAAHCLNTQSEASTVVVYWNYESPTCGALSGGSLSQNQSGAALRATYYWSDMTLLELSSVPDESFDVHYAGWDRSGNGATSAVCIHHPGGDEKSISFEDDAVQSTSYDSTATDPNGDFWRVIDWDDGTTEGGSSGSGLWNAASQRIIGHLTGGYAACGNDESDWYGKLSKGWEGGGTSDSRLRDWLDPDNTGLTGMDGRDPGNSDPTDIDISSSSVTENRPAGTTVGTLSTTDPDAGDTFTYTLVSGTGDTDNDDFAIAGDALETAVSFDYETTSNYNVRVRSTDQGGLWYEEPFAIAIVDVYDPELRILSVTGAPSANVVVQWQSRDGVMYTVESRADMSTAFSAVSDPIAGTTPMNTWTDTVTTTTRAFYRVVESPDPLSNTGLEK